ncbi:MAG: DUF523 domain-containing protein [Erysipelotrichaceae bacterium]|nr:DUF523 domain-containing protein [Erysipelotrichaceae bacterium]
MILISACLAGINCKYNGGNNEVELIRELYEQGKAVAVCPEVYGNLGIPRIPCEKRGDRVYNTRGEDKTGNYVKGALKALEICRQNGCRLAVLKAKSPSCGVNGIYDGTFTHTLIEDDGIFAKMLKDEGVVCLRETDDLKEIEGYL